MPKIFLAAGHWENLFEKTGSKGIKVKGEKKFEEFDFNIGVVDKLHKELKKYKDFEIHQLEYDNDKEDMTLYERIQYINKTSTSTTDLVISVHANYSNKESVGGQWGFYASDAGKRFLNIYNANCNNSPIPYTRTYKCKYDDWTEFGIVLRTKPPAVLLEHGFFSNKKERALLRTDMYQSYCALAILRSILTYYNISKKNDDDKEIDKIAMMKKAINETTDYPDDWIESLVEAVEIANRQSNLGTFEKFKFLPDLILKMKGWI